MIQTALLISLATWLSPTPVPSQSTWTAAGAVTTPQNAPVAGATVAAFDPASLDLIELVEVDAAGFFQIDNLPVSVHLFAKPPAGSDLAGQWLFDQDLQISQAETFLLRHGAPVSFTVQDRQGNPVEGAEVAAYTAGAHRLNGIGVIDVAVTGADGTATLVAPRYAHLVADASSQGYLPSWRFRRRLSTAGTAQLFTLDTGSPTAGRVFSSSLQPLEGMTVSAWSYSNGWHWNGLKQTDASGSYDILAGDRYTHVRAYDPSKERVPGRVWRRGASSSPLRDLTLLDGVPLEIRTEDPDGNPTRAKVWSYAVATRTWMFLGYTQSGELAATVPSSYHLVIRPVDQAFIGRNLWNLTGSTAGVQEVTLDRGRSVEVTVADTTGATLPNVEVRARTGDGTWLGGRRTDHLGNVTVQVAPTGINEIRVWDRSHGSTLERKVLRLNGASDTTSLSVTLSGMTTASGEIRGLDGELVTEPMRVITLSQMGWQRTITETGTYTVPTGDRYHLLVLPLDQDSTFLPSWHWHNMLPSDGVHSRGPVFLTRGYHAEVQVVSKETGDGVQGVQVVGGWPRRSSNSDGWVKTLLRPVYTLRNYPPRVSPSNPNPIIPDHFRAHTTIESERTRESGGPLPPIEVFTQLGTIASGRVTGPRPDGTTGPLAGIRVTTHGGRRYLGDSVTNADGEFHALGIKHDSEYEFTTSFVVRPRRSQPYLADVLRNQELGTPAGSGTNPVGDIEISAAAYGRGRVVDAFGEAIDDRTVAFRARRMDRTPRWHIGWGRANASGEFFTKLAAQTRLIFWTRFWNQGWFRKRFDEEQTFGLGEDVALGDFQLGQAPIVEFRALTSAESAGGYASPMANAFVQLVRISDGKVMDWGRTDSSGDLQLRGPANDPLKLRFSFFVNSYWILGVPFDPVFSQAFEPQETEPFTLTGPMTDLGDYYILSPLKSQSLEVLKVLSEVDPSVFSLGSYVQGALIVAAQSAGRLAALAEPEIDTAVAKNLLGESAALYGRVYHYLNTPGHVTDPNAQAEMSSAVAATLNDINLLIDSLEL